MGVTKKSCWNCYNIFEEAKGIKDATRIFCSEDCHRNYTLVNSVIFFIYKEKETI